MKKDKTLADKKRTLIDMANQFIMETCPSCGGSLGVKRVTKKIKK